MKKIITCTLLIIILAILIVPFKSYANENNTTYSTETNAIINAIENGEITIDGVVKKIETIEIPKTELENNDFNYIVQPYLNSVRDAEPNKIYRIVIPSGTYEMDTRLNVYSNTILDCSDKDGVDIYANSGCAISGGKSSETSLSGYTGYENIIIYGGRYHGVSKDIDVNASNHIIDKPGACIMRFGHATNVNIIRATVIDNCGGHHVEVGAIKNFTVSDCEFYGYTDSSRDSSTLSLEAIQLDVIHRDSGNFSGYGKKDDFSVENAKIIHNYFHDLRRGVGSHHAVYGHPYNNIEISDNTFENIGDKAIIFEYGKNLVIKNNVINNSASGISCGSALGGLFYLPNDEQERNSLTINKDIDLKSEISNNIITLNSNEINLPGSSDISKYGIRVLGGNFTESNNQSQQELDEHNGSNETMPPNGTYFASNLTIKNNTVSTVDNVKIDNIESGIFSAHTKNITITGNNVNIPVSDNATNNAGIMLYDAMSNTISENKIQNSYVGLLISTSQNNLANKNDITNTINNGITIYKSSMENVQGNKVISCGNNAISSSENSNVKSIRDNVIETAKANGISSYKSSIDKILYNDISDVKKGAVTISEQSKVTDTIYHNTINCGDINAYAIGVLSSTVNNISSNKISGKNKIGVNICHSAEVTNVKYNNITSPDTYGIFLYNKATTNSIYKNTISEINKEGISISETSDVTSIRDNVIKNAKTNGISIYKSNVEKILYNNISNVKKGAISVSEKSKITDTIYNNTINCGDINAYAIGVFSSTVNNISSNKISGKNDIGVNICHSAKVTNVKYNNITSSNTYAILIYNKATSKNINNNTINEINKQGISISEGANVTSIRDNVIKNIKENGISIYKSNVEKILYNNISNVKKGAISVSEKSKITDTIYNNTINCGDVNAYAIGVFSSTANNISSNKISGKNKIGVNICHSAKVTNVKYNNITSTNANGILIYNNSIVNNVYNNTISKSKQQGISISEKSTVEKCNNNKLSSCGSNNKIYVSKNSKLYK